jgi:Tfp pilus assembly protein FimV
MLAAALLALGMHAHDARALGLGAIKTKSVLGEPFRAEIALLGADGPPPGSTCFSIDTPASVSGDDLPWLTNARIRTQGNTIYITSPLSINEPIVMVGLKVGCGYELAREYAVLLEPAGRAIAAEQPAVAVAAAPATTATAATAAPVARRQRGAADSSAEPSGSASRDVSKSAPPPKPKARKPRRSAPAVQAPVPDRLFVAPSIDSGNGLKMSGGMVPRAEASEAEREALRTQHKLLAALDEQIATHLAIADKVKQLESRMAELQKQLGRTENALNSSPPGGSRTLPEPIISQDISVPVPAAREPASTETVIADPAPETPNESMATSEAPAGLTNEPVKVINKLPPEPVQMAAETSDAAGVNWLVAALGALAAGAVLGGSWLWRRRAQKLSVATAMRQRHAEEAITRMMVAKPVAETAAARSGWVKDHDDPAEDLPEQRPAVAAVAAAQSAPIESSFEYFPGEAPSEHMEDMKAAAVSPVITGARLETVGIDIELTDSDAAGMTFPAKLDLEFDSFVGSTSSSALRETAVVANGPRLVSNSSTIATGLPFDQTATPANEEVAPSHEHVLELAEIMMSFGRAEGAAQTLSEFLRDYPKESLIPWLKLLDLYHTSGRRGEYDDLAPKLNRAFNVKVPDWEHFSGPVASESVEQFGHIIARIKACWPSQDCLDYLTELLRDNRAGARVGFPLGVIDDILLLKSVLEWHIANPEMTATQAAPRLALI